MVDDETPADRGPRMNLDPRDQATDLRDETCGKKQSTVPQRTCESKMQECVESRIAQHDFQPRARRRVASHERIEIFAKMLENHVSFDIFSVLSALYPTGDTAPEHSYSRDRI